MKKKQLTVFDDEVDSISREVMDAAIKASTVLKKVNNATQVVCRSATNIAKAIVKTEEDRKVTVQIINSNYQTFYTITSEESNKHSEVQNKQEVLSDTLDDCLSQKTDTGNDTEKLMNLLSLLDETSSEIRSR